jgi:hypothetical protein
MMSHQSGQLTVEAVLILTIVASVMFAGSRALRDNNILSSLVENPWSYVAGMIENGIWSPPERGRSQHPNHITRHGSPQGTPP